MPPANTYYNPGGSTAMMQYTTTGNPGSSMNYVTYTVAGSDYINWQNWKPGVGTTTYWYKPSFDFYYCSGPSLHGFNQISYSSSIVAVQQKGYSESNGSTYSLYRMTNTIISNMITNGNTWSTNYISPGTLWSTIEPTYGNWITTSPNYTWGITYDSYYFKVASNTTIQISGSITNPSVVVPVVSNGYMRLA